MLSGMADSNTYEDADACSATVQHTCATYSHQHAHSLSYGHS